MHRYALEETYVLPSLSNIGYKADESYNEKFIFICF